MKAQSTCTLVASFVAFFLLSYAQYGQAETITVEAEDGLITAPFTIGSTNTASGGQYVYTPTRFEGSVAFDVDVTGGDYVVWGHVVAPNGSSGANSFFSSANGATQDVWHISPSEVYANWGFHRVTALTSNPKIFSFPAGTNTIVFSGREQNTRLDYFILTTDLDFIPVSTNVGVFAYHFVQAEESLSLGVATVELSPEASHGRYVHIPANESIDMTFHLESGIEQFYVWERVATFCGNVPTNETQTFSYRVPRTIMNFTQGTGWEFTISVGTNTDMCLDGILVTSDPYYDPNVPDDRVSKDRTPYFPDRFYVSDFVDVTIGWEAPMADQVLIDNDPCLITPGTRPYGYDVEYLVYMGMESGVYTQKWDAGTNNQYRINGLSAGPTYYLSVTAVNPTIGTTSNESPFSCELQYISQAPDVVVEPSSGTYTGTVYLNMYLSKPAPAGSEYKIHYTTDGSLPHAGSPVYDQQFDIPVILTNDVIVKAQVSPILYVNVVGTNNTSVTNGMMASEITTASFVIEPANTPPQIEMPSQIQVVADLYQPISIALNPVVTDDGLLEPLVYTWSQLDGPSSATIVNENEAITSVEIVAAGDYLFSLMVDDGQYSSNSTIRVVANLPSIPEPTWDSRNFIEYVINTNEIHVTWDADENASMYDVQMVWKDPNPVFTYPITNTYNNLIKLNRERTGHFEIRARAVVDGTPQTWMSSANGQVRLIGGATNVPWSIYWKLPPPGGIIIE